MAAGGEELPVMGQGHSVIQLGDGQQLVIPQVQFVPALPCPLLSVSKLEDLGLGLFLTPSKHYMADSKGKVVLEIIRQKGANNSGGLYYLPYSTVEEEQGTSGTAAAVRGGQESWQVWHSRMGHLAPTELHKLKKGQGVRGLTLGGQPENTQDCTHCPAGKQKASTYHPSGKRHPNRLDLLHIDLMGPLVKGAMLNLYVMVMVDDASRHTWVRCLRGKDSAASELKDRLFPLLENQCRRKIMALRTDRGGEFLSGELRGHLDRKGIFHNLTTPYTPQQNGLAEVTNRILGEKVRCMLSESGLPEKYWEFAMRYACWVKNRSPATALPAGLTPFEMYKKYRPSLGMARVWGSMAQVWVPPEKRESKFASRARWGIFIGVAEDEGTKAWKFLMVDRNSVLLSNSAHFHEGLFYKGWRKAIEERGEMGDFEVLLEEREQDSQFPSIYEESSKSGGFCDAGADDSPESGECGDASADDSPESGGFGDAGADDSPESGGLGDAKDKDSPDSGGSVSEATTPKSPNTQADAWLDELLNGGRDKTVEPEEAADILTPPHGAESCGEVSPEDRRSEKGPSEEGLSPHTTPEEGSEEGKSSQEASQEEEMLEEMGQEVRLPGPPLWKSGPGQLRQEEPDLNHTLDSGGSSRNEEVGGEMPLPEGDGDEPVTGFAARYSVRDRKQTQGGRSDGTAAYRGYAHLAAEYKDLAMDFVSLKMRADHFKAPQDLHPKVAWDYKEPKGFKAICNDQFSYFWLKDCDREMRQFMERGVFVWADLPKGKTPLSGHWVQKVKRYIDGTVEKFKVRFVVHGNRSQAGVHYNQTFAPTPDTTTARVLLALATVLDWEVDQVDVSAAFLYANLDEEIYMLPPEGYDDGSGRVWRLCKALYGLKQAPRQWNSELTVELAKQNFVQSPLDPSLYIKKEGKDVIYLLDFVDDMLMFCPNRAFLDREKAKIADIWEVTDLGPAEKYLGWHIRRDRTRRKTWLTIDKKIKETALTFGVAGCKPTQTPLPSGFDALLPHEMDPEDPERQPEEGSNHVYSHLLNKTEHHKYRSLVGSLQYFANCLRPDVAHAANTLAQVAHCPRERHWQAALHCLKYLSGTPDLALHYHADTQGQTLLGYTDSDFAGCKGTRKSTTGWIFTMAGGPVAWKSKRQEVITLSSCEAEYRALTNTVQEAMWLRDLLAELGWKVGRPTQIYCDNEAAVRISKDPVNRAKTKHAALSFLFVREQQALGKVSVIPIGTKQQTADYLTKGVTRVAAENCKKLAGQSEAPPKQKK